jgi:hypothetical protein
VGLTVMGVDPGQTTGVVVTSDECFDEIKKCGFVEHVEGNCGHCWYEEVKSQPPVLGYIHSSERAAVLRLSGLVVEASPDVIVMEDFILYTWRSLSSARTGLSPVRIGVGLSIWLEDVLEYEGRCVYQLAAQAKSVFTDDRLRRRGFWIKGSAHCRDAARHALLAVRRIKNGEI